MKNFLSILISFLIFGQSLAQNGSSNIQQKLERFIGEWKGNGWHYHNPQKTNYFEQTCTITPRLDGHLLSVEQLATLADHPETIIFREFSLWRLNDDGSITAESYRQQSSPRKQLFTFENGKLIQSINDGRISYISEITEKGEYLMTGYNIDSAGKKELFFEMKLEKIR